MFEHLGKHRRIYVTGPFRSGTTICSKMIGLDTQRRTIDEMEFRVNHRDRLDQLLDFAGDERLVVQCPALCWCIHEIAGDDDLVVLMRRPLEEINASRNRARFTVGQAIRELSRYGLTEGDPSAVKYAHWDAGQRDRIANTLEVQYASLANHPLWVPREERAGWRVKQTAPREAPRPRRTQVSMPKPPATGSRTACRLRGEPIGLARCTSCRGKPVRLKVYSCPERGPCVLDRVVAGHATCSVCPVRQP